MTQDRPIAIASDHAGPALKAAIAAMLRAEGRAVIDLGTEGGASVDYPDFAHELCRAVESGQAGFGILICGTGIGMSMAANRHAGIRCALLHETTSARLTRRHNDANVMAIGARMLGEELALDIVRVFLSTPFEGGRHARRLAKLDPIAEPIP